MARTVPMRVALTIIAVSIAAAPAQAATHRASCDEIPGENQAVNDRWRIFSAAGQGTDMLLDPRTWACERTPRPARRILVLTDFGVGATKLVGDIAEMQGDTKYGNDWSTFVDLQTLKARTRHGDGRDPADPRSELLATGALVSLPYNAIGNGPAGEAVPPALRVGELTTTDSLGTHVVEPGSRWSADGKAFLSVAPAASDLLPFGAGFYYTAADGSLRRHVPVGGAPSTADWHRTRLRWKRYAGRAPNRPGIRTTYPSYRELRSRPARGGRPATLSLHTPFYDSVDATPPSSDLVARLVPGSEGELQLLGSVVVGRFADQPEQRRIRIPQYARANRFRVNIPAPDAIDPVTFAQRNGDVVYVTGGELVLLLKDHEDGSYAVRRAPAPPGFRDPAFVPPKLRSESDELIYTDAAGQPVRIQYREPD